MGEVNVDEDLAEGAAAAAPGGFFSGRRLIILAIVVGLIVLALAGFFMMNWLGPGKSNSPRPVAVMQAEKKAPAKKKKVKWAPLYGQMTADQAAEVLKELSAAQIEFKQEQAGKNFSVSVDEDQLDKAKNLLAIKGLPAGGSKGYELLDQGQTLGVTDFDKRIRFLRALSGELEKAIMQMDMIETAKVQIVLPEQRLFAVTQPPVTASVLIRRKMGAKIDDDVVFSIIQLVSNAVENLQPENVSIIDTEGFVLSAGIFERLAAKEAGLGPKKEEAPTQPAKEAQPIIPDYKKMKRWYELKHKFETEMEDKATKQLLGVLPLGSFKLAITAEIGPVPDSETLDIKRLSAGVVIDNNNDQIYLDSLLKKEIFNTVAGAIGYVKGRDVIQLSKADFLTFTPEEQKRLAMLKKKPATASKKRWAWAAVPLGLLALLLLVWRSLRRRRKAAEPEEVGFEDLMAPSLEPALSQVRVAARETPELVAQVMENWLTEEGGAA
jgi:flagellar biosynthesis/type III secretory pathway M-ring protein FliF/YscJ